MAEIRLVNLIKKYDKVLAVAGIDLEVSEKESVVLVGPSWEDLCLPLKGGTWSRGNEVRG